MCIYKQTPIDTDKRPRIYLEQHLYKKKKIEFRYTKYLLQYQVPNNIHGTYLQTMPLHSMTDFLNHVVKIYVFFPQNYVTSIYIFFFFFFWYLPTSQIYPFFIIHAATPRLLKLEANTASNCKKKPRLSEKNSNFGNVANNHL